MKLPQPFVSHPGAGDAAMHVILVLIVLGAVVAYLLLARRRDRKAPVERFDSISDRGDDQRSQP